MCGAGCTSRFPGVATRVHVYTACLGVFVVGSGRRMLFDMALGLLRVVVEWTAMRSKDPKIKGPAVVLGSGTF